VLFDSAVSHLVPVVMKVPEGRVEDLPYRNIVLATKTLKACGDTHLFFNGSVLGELKDNLVHVLLPDFVVCCGATVSALVTTCDRGGGGNAPALEMTVRSMPCTFWWSFISTSVASVRR
jgi:hypothetical protein